MEAQAGPVHATPATKNAKARKRHAFFITYTIRLPGYRFNRAVLQLFFRGDLFKLCEVKRMLTIFAVVLTLLVEGSLGAFSVAPTKKPGCCGTAPCTAKLSCCHPAGQKTTPVPVSQTNAQLGKVFDLAQSSAVPVLNDQAPLFSYLRGVHHTTHAPPLFILNSSLLI